MGKALNNSDKSLSVREGKEGRRKRWKGGGSAKLRTHMNTNTTLYEHIAGTEEKVTANIYIFKLFTFNYRRKGFSLIFGGSANE